jgi:hypothetical protein
MLFFFLLGSSAGPAETSSETLGQLLMLFFFLLGPSAGPAETSSEKEEKCEDQEQAAEEHSHHIQQVELHKTEAMRGTSHGGVMRMPEIESKHNSFFK